MLCRLGVTGCCSRVALSEMLRGFAKSFSSVLRCRNVVRPGPDRPNVPICRYGSRVVVIFASVPAGFGPGPKAVVEERAAGPFSSDFLVFPCAAWGARGAGAGRPLLLPYWTRSRAARWRARSRSWTAAATSLLDEVYAFLRAARWRALSRSWTAAATCLLDEVYAFLRAAKWRARSRSWTAASNTLLDEVSYPTTDPAPTSGLARRRWRKGARRYLESASLHLSPLTSGLARRRRRRGVQLDGECAFYASRCRLWAGPGGGGGGAAYETGSLLSIVFGSRSLLRPGDKGKRANGQRVCIPMPFAAEFGPMEAWLKGLLLRLALAGLAGDTKNALLRRRLGCNVAYCA